MRAWTTSAAAVLAAAVTSVAAATAAVATTAPALSTDATGPLFSAGLLAPGNPLERCLLVSWSGAAGAVLGISADVEGSLAQYLDVTVQTGTGGGYAGCGEFTAAGAGWQGTLAELGAARDAVAGQVPLTQVPDASGSTTVRITMVVRDDNRAQSLSATGLVRFALAGGSPTPTGPTSEPTSEPTAEPSSEPGPDPDEEPSPDAQADPTATPRAVTGASGTPTPVAPTADASPAPDASATPLVPDTDPSDAPRPESTASVDVPLLPGPPAGGADGSWLPESVQQFIETAGVAATSVARAVGWSFWTGPVIVLFLLVQNRIDARDPKLAEAPAEAVPGLLFDDVHGGGAPGGPLVIGGTS